QANSSGRLMLTHVEAFRGHQYCRVCARAGHRAYGLAASRSDLFDKARLADRDVDQSSRRIEEGHMWRPRNWPDIHDLAGSAVDFDQRAVVACGIEPAAGVVVVETMRAAAWKLPLRDRA